MKNFNSLKRFFLFAFICGISSIMAFGQVEFTADFESGIPSGWSQSGYTATTSQACSGTSIRDNMYSGSTTGNLTTATAISNGTDVTFAFDYKVVDWSAATAATAAGWGSIELQYNVNGNGFVSFDTINDANHVTSNVCATFSSTLPSVNVPSDSSLEFRILATWGTSGDYYLYLDNVSIKQVISCPSPSALSSNGITASSADINWTENGTATSWRVEWDTTGYAAGTARNSMVVMTDTFTTVMGLNAETTYDWGVMALCSSSDSSSLVTGSFTTPCAAISAPMVEDFTTFVPNCWDEATSGDLTTGPTGLGSGSWGASSYANGAASGSGVKINLFTNNRSDWILSPTIDLSGGSYELVIDAALTGYNNSNSGAMGSDDSVQVVISTDNGVTWTSIYTWTVNNEPSTTGTLFNIDLSSYTSANNIIGIYATDGPVDDSEDYDFHIGNFEVRVPPACAAPTVNMASNITTTSADLSWLENGTATSWRVEWDTTGYPAGTARNTMVVMTDTFTTISGLSAQTAYDWNVQSLCSATDSSAQVGGSFTTPCNSVSSFPYTENFEAYGDGDIPACWSNRLFSGTSNWLAQDGSGGDISAAHGGTVWFEKNYLSSEALAISPAFDLSAIGSDSRVRVWLHRHGSANANDQYVVMINNVDSINGADTLLDLFSLTSIAPTVASTGWYEYTIDIPSSYNSSTNAYILIKGNTSAGFSSYDLGIDDFTLEAKPACLAPTANSASSLAPDSAIVSWIENGTATQWELEWDTAGFTLGSGNSVIINTDTFDIINGLTENSTYEWRVRAICGSSDSSTWTSISSFTTPCSAIMAPFSEGFSSSSIPACWSQGAGNSENWLFSHNGQHIGNVGNMGSGVTSSGATSTSGMAVVDDSSPHNTSTTLETPFIDVSSLTTPRLTFFTISDNEGDANGNVDFHVDVYDGAAWNDSIFFSDTNSLNGTWEKIIIDLSSLTITGPIQIRFVVDENNGGGFDDDRAIDDVVVEETPSCFAVTGLSATTISSDSASIAWSTANTPIAPSYQVSYGLTGTAPGAGTMYVTSNNPDTITGLMAASNYDVYVRAICSSTDTSAWSTVATFATACPPAIMAPYTQTFDLTSTPTCWSQSAVSGGPWVFGTSSFTWNTQGCAGVPVDHTGNGGNFAALDFSVPDAGVVLELPTIDVTNIAVPYFEFYYTQCVNLNPNNILYIEAFDGTNWGPLDSITRGTNGWERFGFLAGNYTYSTNLVRLRFRAEDGGGTQFYGDMGIDDVTVGNAPANDIAVTDVITPASGCGLSVSEVVQVEITNLGSATQTGFSVVYELNGVAVSPETFTGSLASGASATFNFTATADLSTVGAYEIKAYTQLTGDVDTTNDTSEVVVTSSANITTFPYAESFEAGDGGWIVTGNASWALGTPAGTIIDTASDGTQAWVTNLAGNYGDNEVGFVNSPCLDFTNVADPYIELDIWYDIETSWDGATMQSSIDGGTTWQLVGALNDPNNWYNDGTIDALASTEPSEDGWSGSPGSGGWLTAENRLTGLGGLSNVLIRIAFASDGNTNDEGMAFDNIVISNVPKAPISLPITWDDGATVDLTTIDFGGNASMVVTDPTDPSNMVLEGIKGAGAQTWAGTSFGDSLATAIPFDASNTIISAVVWSPDSGVTVKLKVEDHTTPSISVETDVVTSKTGWDTLRFDMSLHSVGAPLNLSNTYDKMSIFYNFGVMPTVADTFYVDFVDFTGGTAPPPAKAKIGLPITWEDTANVDYTVVDFGGNASMMTTDPMNSSNLVLQSVKTVGAQVWAGTSFGNSLDSAIAFSAGNTTIRAVVYSPIIGAEVRVKVEDQTNPGISVESVDTTTVIGWDTLNFDMSMNASGTAAINFANTYDKMSIFYNFGVMPTVADTFYVDYVAFENPPVVVVDPYYPIGVINTEDATTGDADSLGVDCWISGITIGYNKRGSGVDFSIVDMSTGSQEGITLFDFNPVSGYVFQEGDSLMVHGTVSQFRGLTQFSPDSISIIASGVTLPTPIIANIFDESTESKLVQTTDDFVIITTPGSGSFNLDLSNGTDTVTIRIDSDSDIDDSLAIATNAWVVGDTLCGMIGVGGQFDFNTPFLDSYQMFPRSWNDITVCKNTIGINDNSKNNVFSIYPNPSNGMVTIESTGYNSNRVEIEVLDLNGRTVASSLVLNGTAPSRELLDLSDVAKGIYFVSIIDGENRLVEKLIIK